MPYLKLISLDCIDQEDDTGPDEPYLVINGKKIDCGSMSEGQSKSLLNEGMFKFDGNILVNLWDYDWPDSDDNLGQGRITATDAIDPERELTTKFKKDDAEYNLNYKVIPS